MDETNSLANINPQNDPEWKEIVEKICKEMGQDNTVPEQVIEATELMLCGWPTYKIAKRLAVKPTTVRRWLEIYPTMALAIAKGRPLLQQWRMAKLEQQYLLAIEKSEEILDLDMEDRAVNQKLVATIAQHARFIIGLFAGQKIDVSVTVEEGQESLKAKQDALDYLAQALGQQRKSEEPIEAVYRVVSTDPDEDNSKPMLLADGNPAYGKLGELDINEEGVLCHICGKRVQKLGMHVRTQHKLKAKIYEMIYMLDAGALKETGDMPDESTESDN